MDKFDVPIRFPFINKPFNRIDRIAENNYVDITWILNTSCPHHCWYCPDYIHRGSNKTYEWHHVDLFVDILFERYPSCHFSISGGEPTTWPYINNLIEKIISNPKATIGINSNIMRTQRWWDKFADKLTYVAASYHPSVELTNKQRSEFIDKCHYIAEKTQLGLRLMMDPNHWDHCIELYENLKNTERKFTVEPVRILDYSDGFSKVGYFKGYTEEQENILSSLTSLYSSNLDFNYKSNSFKDYTKVTYDDGTVLDIDHVGLIILNKANKFKGWKCNIGIESLFIDSKGDIKRGNCNVGGWLGNITNPIKVKWPDNNPVFCNVDQCHCLTDLQLTKWKE